MRIKKKIASLVMLAGIVSIIATGCGGGGNSKNVSSDGSGWDSGNDIAVISREDGSGTRGAFVELFGVEVKEGDKKIDKTSGEAQITNSTSVMMTTVAGDDYSIGYISMGSLNDTVKALKIDGSDPTEENVKNGSYKISRPFNIVTKKDIKNELVEDFIKYILSKEGQEVVTANHFISIDNALTYDGTKPSGKLTVGGSSSVSPVMEKLIEAYKKVNQNAIIELQATDSTTGVTSTLDGSYDIGMASRELKDTEISKGAKPIVIATDGIAVIVNKNSSVEGLTKDQIKSIYIGEIMSWNEVVK